MGALGDELSRLRHGRGIMAGDLGERLGPTLRAVAGIDPDGHPDDIRQRLTRFLEEQAISLPEDLRTAFAAALALREDVRHRFLEERMRWLADTLHRDIRTARRRADEAIRIVAASASPPAGPASGDPLGDWYLARLCTVLLLDGARPTAIEERLVVAARDDVGEIVISTGIPFPDGEVTGARGAELTVLQGGTLISSEWPTAGYFRNSITLARTLRLGESHTISVRVVIPEGQPFARRYAFQPLRRCDEFDLRIRFGSSGRAKHAWKLSGLPRGMVDDYAAPEALIRPDANGDVELRYEHLRVGLTYGARWSD